MTYLLDAWGLTASEDLIAWRALPQVSKLGAVVGPTEMLGQRATHQFSSSAAFGAGGIVRWMSAGIDGNEDSEYAPAHGP